MTPYLFLSPGRHALLTRLLDRDDPSALAMAGALDTAPPEGDDQAQPSVNGLYRAWLRNDREQAETEGETLLRALATPHSDLGKGSYGLRVALALDAGRDLWSDDLRRRMVDRAADLARSVTVVTKGNPHIVTNNWYMITHAGCLLACLAAHGEPGTRGKTDLADIEAWALGRFRAFLGHFGNAGLYHEGTGYIAYTLSLLMPALVALRNRRGLDLTEDFPNLRLSIRSMLTGTTLSSDGEHIMLDWNDTGRGAAGLNPLIPGMALAPREDRPALREAFDRTRGVKGMNAWTCAYEGLSLALALYPFDLSPEDPNARLPRHLVDTRQGLAFWRDAWSAGSDTLVGWYARSTHASPGHSHDDAGSLRMSCRGVPWICGPGQARSKAIWQSALTHAREEDRPKQTPYAYPFTHRMDDKGGMAGLDLRKVLGCYAERYLTWRVDQGLPLCMAMLDLVEEHQTPPRPFTWNLTFPKELSGNPDADGRGFRLEAPGREGVLHARFLLDAPDNLSIQSIPASSRTFSGGATHEYPGDHYIAGRFEPRARLRVLVALAVVAPDQPAPDFAWEDPHIRLGPEHLWTRPFHGAILDTVRLDRHAPNLQRAPAGEEESP